MPQALEYLNYALAGQHTEIIKYFYLKVRRLNVD